MNVTIIGAGELGRLLAQTLLDKGYNVSILDSSQEELEKISSKLDVKTVDGRCTDIVKLKEAGVEDADIVLAVSGDEAANILACQLVDKLNTKKAKTICRFYRSDNLTEFVDKKTFGITEIVSPPEACAEKIKDVWDTPILQEIIRFNRSGNNVPLKRKEGGKISGKWWKKIVSSLFSRPAAKENFPVPAQVEADISEAAMAVIRLDYSSPLVEKGKTIGEISETSIPDDIRQSIRYAAIFRKNQLVVPRGGKKFIHGDKVYVAGQKKAIDRFLDWLSFPNGEGRITTKKIVLYGSDETGKLLIRKAQDEGLDIRVIEPDREKCEEIQEYFSSNVLVLNGDATEEDVLLEAGMGTKSEAVFIAASSDDENNILSCILAKQLGARKVICLTHKPEYGKIVSSMDRIDSGFSASLVSVNAMLKQIEGTMRADMILQRSKAHLLEYEISARSPLCGQPVKCKKIPQELILALVFRGSKMIVPSGDTELKEKDKVVAIIKEDDMKKINELFPVDETDHK